MQEKTGFPGLAHVFPFSNGCSWEADIFVVTVKRNWNQNSQTAVLIQDYTKSHFGRCSGKKLSEAEILSHCINPINTFDVKNKSKIHKHNWDKDIFSSLKLNIKFR